jgi:hypothetical protein
MSIGSAGGGVADSRKEICDYAGSQWSIGGVVASVIVIVIGIAVGCIVGIFIGLVNGWIEIGC